MRLRPATMDDAATLLAWRNDPVTMAACVDQTPVSWDDHVAWLGRVLADPGRRLLVVERDGVALATGRFDYDEPTEFSFTIAPEHRGKGASLKMMKLAMSAETRFIAYIRAENTSCQRLGKVCGMEMINDGPMQLWSYGRPHHRATRPVVQSRLLCGRSLA